jgi:hypothetical protein
LKSSLALPAGRAVANANTALHLACLALGSGPGDEVIVPSLSFVATANAVLYTGAEVRFADILGPDELTLDPAAVEALITTRTEAAAARELILPSSPAWGKKPCRWLPPPCSTPCSARRLVRGHEPNVNGKEQYGNGHAVVSPDIHLTI